MASDFPSSDEVRCSYHPDTLTRLRCGRCGKPICPKCGVRSPVGLRCPDCAGVRGLPTYATSKDALAKGAAIGLAVAVVIGVIWSQAPQWGFYLALILGFAVAEALAWAVKGKRGTDIQAVGIALVVLSLLISRYLIFRDHGVPFDQFLNLDAYIAFDEFGRRVSAQEILHVQLIPDGIIALLPIVIVWYRFR
ncbi:hypothetical protein BH09CHL1_BH09CHL1_24830 [soil metagenome]